MSTVHTIQLRIPPANLNALESAVRSFFLDRAAKRHSMTAPFYTDSKGRGTMIPGFIISLLTFPGVIVHEFAHKWFCRLTGTEVIEVCYFRFGNPTGYVIHASPSTVWKHILIGIGPVVVNTVMGFFIGLFAIRNVQLEGVGAVLIWLGVSIAMHAFPSTGDAKSIWRAVSQKESPRGARLVGAPLVAIIYLGAIGSVFWLDLIYGVVVAVFVPSMLLSMLAVTPFVVPAATPLVASAATDTVATPKMTLVPPSPSVAEPTLKPPTSSSANDAFPIGGIARPPNHSRQASWLRFRLGIAGRVGFL